MKGRILILALWLLTGCACELQPPERLYILAEKDQEIVLSQDGVKTTLRDSLSPF